MFHRVRSAIESATSAGPMEEHRGGLTLLGPGWSAEPGPEWSVGPGPEWSVGTPDRPLRVVAINDSPYLSVQQRSDGSVTYSGYLFQLWHIIAEELGLSYNISAPLTDGYGSQTTNGTWTGVIGDLVYGRADLALNWLTATPERAAVVDFLDGVPCASALSTFLVRRDTAVTPSLSPAVFAGLLRPLGADVWWTLAAMLLALSLVLRLSLRFNSARAEDGRLVRDMGWGSCLLAVVMTVLGQGWDRTPRSLAGRTVTIFGWMLGILIYINYTANLMSFLTVHTVSKPISSVREFVEQPDWTLAMHPGSQKLVELRSSKDTYERELYRRSRPPTEYYRRSNIPYGICSSGALLTMAVANTLLGLYRSGDRRKSATGRVTHRTPGLVMATPTYRAPSQDRAATMDSMPCMKSYESEASLLVGYRRLDSAGDDLEPMTICSSEDEFSDSDSSDLDSASDIAGSPRASHPMTDALDLRPLLESPRHRGTTDADRPALSRHVPSWVMRTQQDDSNANAVPAPLATLTAMSGLSPPISSLSPLSPAIEKAEIEKSEKPTEISGEINGNMVVYKDGARPKATSERVKTSRHAGVVMNKSPKHHRRSTTAEELDRRDLRVHFSNDAGVPRKQEKMMMNTSLKMSLESPRRPRPNTLPVVSHGFDVYNLETSLPKIDWDAIENHLKSVREEERKSRLESTLLDVA
ncbi:Glutamate receptor 4 [Amphibalanus amphitrite]|uniref:Glutamate receptor 4 n=1 Tax=Amphibalanus amphitrite TaxID=1232801 RepID=A0A6A4V9W1_AMPAM|nr:Glutamate receptor 4 [Amphibalanus amphitrite]